MEAVLKLRLYLDEESARVLDGQSKIANWLYNHLLEEAKNLREVYRNTGDSGAGQTLYTKRGLRNLVPGLKEKHPFLKAVHSSPLKNAALRLSGAIQDYQKSRKGKRRGKKTGWPRFRSVKHKFFSLLYDEANKGFKVDGKSIRLSLGSDATGKRLYVTGLLEKSPEDFSGRLIRNLRVTREGQDYYCIFTVLMPEPNSKPREKVIAFDPNHKNLLYGVGSDSRAIELKNPYFMKPLQSRIDALKSRRDRCQKKSRQIERPDGSRVWAPSRRWKFFDNKLQRTYQLRREQTKVFLYTVSHWLNRNYDVISIGDYTPRGGGINRGMRRAMNNESLIGRLKQTVCWVTGKSGHLYHEWNEKGSTRTCHACGYVLAEGLGPDIRVWNCPNPECGLTHIRDENAARNGLKRTLKELKFPGSGHLLSSLHIDDEKRWALRFDGLGLRMFPNPGAGVR